MEIKLIWNDGEVVRLDSLGKLSRDGWTGNRDPLGDLFGEGIYGKKVLLNLLHSQYVDSTGVEWLLSTHKRFQKAGGKLVVHSANVVMQQILKMMRMDLVLNIAKDEAGGRVMLNGENGENHG